MFFQLALGSFVVSSSLAIAAIFVGVAIRVLTHYGPWLTKPPHTYKIIIVLVGVTLWLLASLSLSVWLWAAVYVWVGAFAALEPALYFSVVAFSTLGFGDIILPVQWRLLSGICAANGMILFGLTTAFLVEFLSRLRRAQEKLTLD